MKKEALRIWCVVPASPHAVYMAWIDSAQHSAFTGGKAVIDSAVGGKFTAWDGYIQGKHIQLDLGRRVIQSWRTNDFPKGSTDSRFEVHFEPVIDGTRITILHSEIPEGQAEKYKAGWVDRYFNPMRTYFGKLAIQADRASVARLAQLANRRDEDEQPVEPAPKKGAKIPPPKKGAVVAPPPKKSAPVPAKPVKIEKIEKKAEKKPEKKPEKKVEKKIAKKADKKADKKAKKADKKAKKADKGDKKKKKK